MERGRTRIQLAARGIGIYFAWMNGVYANQSDTSMAALFVSGAVALAKMPSQNRIFSQFFNSCPSYTGL